MKPMSRLRIVAVVIGTVLAVSSLVALLRFTSLGRASTWQALASPGQLSTAHTFLENNCAACHTATRGPDPAKCIVCHANNEPLLQRQPTTFHADIGSCQECHVEHLGPHHRPTDMDHVALAKIGLRQLGTGLHTDEEAKKTQKQLLAWINQVASPDALPTVHPGISPLEMTLNCSSCHGSKDRHFKFFGSDCAQCHSTAKWTIPEFKHPSPSSKDCAQCHQSPPSHYMGHFHMVSAKVAGKPHAKVNQCFLCHQTTSWNDIKGVGWYKHH